MNTEKGNPMDEVPNYVSYVSNDLSLRHHYSRKLE